MGFVLVKFLVTCYFPHLIPVYPKQLKNLKYAAFPKKKKQTKLNIASYMVSSSYLVGWCPQNYAQTTSTQRINEPIWVRYAFQVFLFCI